MKKNFAILVLSCDKYTDLWDIFFECFDKYWSDCLYQIYLGSNTVNYDRADVKVIKSGYDKNWSYSTKKILEQIEEKYIWIFLEDILIGSLVDSKMIEKTFDFMQQNKIKHIHEQPLPKADKVIDQYFGIYEKGAPYRVNVRGLWDRDYLIKLLIDGESPWDFEIMGSYRTSYDEGFYCLLKSPTLLINSVEKGKFFPEAIKWCKENNIKSIENNNREILTGKINIKSKMQKFIFDNIIKIPWKYRVKLMNILRKALISY